MPNTIRMIRSRRKRWTGHVARMGDKKCIQNFGWKNLKGRENLEDLGVDGKIKLERTLGKYGGKVWTGCRTNSGLL
jgi:hypothetical protein